MGRGQRGGGMGYKHSNLAKRFIITTTASSHRPRHIDGSMIGSVGSIGGLIGERNVERVSGKQWIKNERWLMSGGMRHIFLFL
jgi:hypothetical protein